MARAAEDTEQHIGRYSVIRRLARGGMAELFLARASGIHGFQKIVALKRILPTFAGDPEFIRMFLDEARLAANLEHPNIAAVYDIGRDGDDYFFTMEYVHGETLRAILGKAAGDGPGLPLSYAVSIGIGIAAGIHHAHSRIGYDGKPLGLVHRDISPTNVIVSYDGAVKVLDFGIAKAAASSHVTSEGTRKGKVAYMSPEQVRDEELDHRSDIFSIGIVLWEMATLRPLFGGGNEFAVMRKILEQPAPRPSTVQPQIPPDLDDIIMRALALDPVDRFASALDLQLALEAVARDHRFDSTQGALGRYIGSAFGARPFPWEDTELDPPASDGDDPVALTSELPPTRALPKPAFAIEAEGSQRPFGDTSQVASISPPRRPGTVMMVAAGIAAGVAIVAWAVASSGEPPRPPANAAPRAPPSSSEPANAASKPQPGTEMPEREPSTPPTAPAAPPPDAEPAAPPSGASPERAPSSKKRKKKDGGPARPRPSEPDYGRMFDF